MESLVVHRECPFHLIKRGRAEKMTGIIRRRKRSFEPAFVQAHPIGINRFYEMPGKPEFAAQRLVLTKPPGQIFDGHGPYWLIGMRPAENKSLPGTARDSQH